MNLNGAELFFSFATKYPTLCQVLANFLNCYEYLKSERTYVTPAVLTLKIYQINISLRTYNFSIECTKVLTLNRTLDFIQ